MTADSPHEPAAVREAVVRKRKGIQTVWIIPIVAALVGGWLWYRALQDQGPIISISFKTADGLEAGKTKLKFKDLEVGEVTDVQLDDDLEHVIATAEMAPGSEPYLVDTTRFWVVRPRIGTGGISGLGTIVSGAYVAMDLSTRGAPTLTFEGLEEPPARPVDAAGLRVKLQADSLGSISTGTVISHLQIPMGDVEGYRYLRDDEMIEFDLYIEEEYANLVRTNTRFWSASGLDVSLNSEGFQVHADSLEAILMGGIAFGSAPGQEPAAPAQTGHVFRLLESKEEAQKITTKPRRSVLYFNEPVGGLGVGSPVEFQGIEIGQVLEVGVEADPETLTYRMPVIVETYPDRLSLGQDAADEAHSARMERLIAAGVRAQLGPANLLTGARNIAIDFHPDTEAVLQGTGSTGLPELPTIPSTGEALAAMLTELPEIVSGLRETVDGVAALVGSAETGETLESLRESTESLNRLLANLDSVVAEVRSGTPDLMGSLQQTVDAAHGMLESGEQGVASLVTDLPMIQQRLSVALQEIGSGMRSLAGLADYLERHPEALLKGKPDSGGQ